MGLLGKIFGGPKGGNYKNLESYLRGRVTPSSNENEVKAQLERTLQDLPPDKKKAFEAYISGGAWKKTFLKK